MANNTDPQNVEQTQGNRPQTSTKSKLEARQLDREERKKKRLQRRELLEHIANNPSSYEPYLKEGEGYRDFMGRVEDLYDNDIITNVEDAQKYFSAPDLNAKYKVQGSISYNGTNYNVDQTFTNDWEKKFRQVHENWASKNLSKSEQKEYLMDLEKQIRDIKSGKFSLNTNTLAGQNTAQILAKMQGIADKVTREESEQKASDESAVKKKEEEELAKKWGKFDYAVENDLNDDAKRILQDIIGETPFVVDNNNIKKSIDKLLLDNEDYRAHRDNIYKAYGLEVPAVVDDGGAAGDSGGNQDEEESWTLGVQGNTFTFQNDINTIEGAENFIDDLLIGFKEQYGDAIKTNNTYNKYRLYSYGIGDGNIMYLMKSGDDNLSQSDFNKEQKIAVRFKNGETFFGTLKDGKIILSDGSTQSNIDFKDQAKAKALTISDEYFQRNGEEGSVMGNEGVDVSTQVIPQTSLNIANYKNIIRSNKKISGIDWYDTFQAIDPNLNNISNTFYDSMSGNQWDNGQGFLKGVANLKDALAKESLGEPSLIPKIKKWLTLSGGDGGDRRYSMSIAFMLHYILQDQNVDSSIKNKAVSLLNEIKNIWGSTYNTYFTEAQQVQSNKQGGILKAQFGTEIQVVKPQKQEVVQEEQITEQPEQITEEQPKERYARLDSEQGVLAGISTVASVASIMGGIPGGVAGMVSSAADIAGFWLDEDMSTSEKMKQSALSLAMGALCFIPGLGVAAKAGKFARMAKGTKSILNGSKRVLTTAVKGMDATTDAAKNINTGIKMLDDAMGIASKPGFAQKACSVFGSEGFGGIGYELITRGTKTLPKIVEDFAAKGHVTKVGNSINNILTAVGLYSGVGSTVNLVSDIANEDKSWAQLNAYDIQNIAFGISGIRNWRSRTKYSRKYNAIDDIIGSTPKTQSKNITVEVGTSKKWNPTHMGSKTHKLEIPVSGQMTKQEVQAAVRQHIQNLPDDEANKVFKDMLNGNMFVNYDKSQFDDFNDLYYFINNIENNASSIQQKYIEQAKKAGLFTEDQFNALRRWENGMPNELGQQFVGNVKEGKIKTQQDMLDYLVNLKANTTAPKPQTTPNPQAVPTPSAAPNPPATSKPVSAPQQLSQLNKRGGTLVTYNKKGGSLSYEDRVALQAFKSKLSREEREYIQRLKNRNQELKISYQSFKNALDRIDANKDKATKGLLTTRLLILKSLM